jgi:hypothetical protein
MRCNQQARRRGFPSLDLSRWRNSGGGAGLQPPACFVGHRGVGHGVGRLRAGNARRVVARFF